MAHNVEVFAKECFRVSNSILHKQNNSKLLTGKKYLMNHPSHVDLTVYLR